MRRHVHALEVKSLRSWLLGVHDRNELGYSRIRAILLVAVLLRHEQFLFGHLLVLVWILLESFLLLFSHPINDAYLLVGALIGLFSLRLDGCFDNLLGNLDRLNTAQLLRNAGDFALGWDMVAITDDV